MQFQTVSTHSGPNQDSKNFIIFEDCWQCGRCVVFHIRHILSQPLSSDLSVNEPISRLPDSNFSSTDIIHLPSQIKLTYRTCSSVVNPIAGFQLHNFRYSINFSLKYKVSSRSTDFQTTLGNT